MNQTDHPDSRLVLVTDGSWHESEPQCAIWAWVASASGAITDLTEEWRSHRSEFVALMQALRWAQQEARGRPIECRSDSSTLACALVTPSCHPSFQDLHDQTRALVHALGARVVCVQRKVVRPADWPCRRTWKAYFDRYIQRMEALALAAMDAGAEGQP